MRRRVADDGVIVYYSTTTSTVQVNGVNQTVTDEQRGKLAQIDPVGSHVISGGHVWGSADKREYYTMEQLKYVRVKRKDYQTKTLKG